MRAGIGRGASRLCSISGVKRFALLHEPGPSLLLAWARCLLNGDRKISDFPVDFVARQHVQPGQEDGAFEDGVGGAVETFERRMLLLMQNLAMEAGALGVGFEMRDFEFGVGERSRKTRHGNLCRGHEGPVTPAGDEPGENARVVGVIGDGDRGFHEIVVSCRREKRRDDPAIAVLDETERRQMGSGPIDRRS